MARVTLELDELSILRPKKRWRIYFVLVTEHPEDENKRIVGTFPDPYIRMKPPMKNVLHFEPEGQGADGLIAFQRDMPEDRTVKARIYLRNSRSETRNIGSFLSDVKSGLGGQAFDIVDNIAGSSVPWLVIAKEAVSLLGNVLKGIKDRDMGMINLDEEFGPEFENQTELDRSNTFSTGEAKLVWSWNMMD